MLIHGAVITVGPLLLSERADSALPGGWSPISASGTVATGMGGPEQFS